MTWEQALRWAATFRLPGLWATARLTAQGGVVCVRVPGRGLVFCHTAEEAGALALSLARR